MWAGIFVFYRPKSLLNPPPPLTTKYYIKTHSIALNFTSVVFNNKLVLDSERSAVNIFSTRNLVAIFQCRASSECISKRFVALKSFFFF